MLCLVAQSCLRLFMTPWTVACQAPLFVEFSRQESWAELSFPTPGDFPDPGIELTSLESPALAGEFFTTHWATWEYIYSSVYMSIPIF